MSQRMVQASIAKYMGWLAVSFWLPQELDIDLNFLQGKDTGEIGEFLNRVYQHYLKIFTDGPRDPVSGKSGFRVDRGG